MPRSDVRAIAQPPEYSPSPTDGFYRVFSIFLSVPLSRLGAAPNAITVAWILVGLGGVAALLAGSWPVRVAGALLLQLSYLLDFVDGEVARLRRRLSLVGGFLDLAGHGLIKAALPLAVGASAAAVAGRPAWLAAGAVGSVALIVGDSLRFYAACTSADLGAGDLGHAPAPARRAGARHRPGRLVRALATLSFETPGLYATVLLAAVLDRLDLLAISWGLGAPLWMLARAVGYARRLAALAPASGRGPTAA
ncbi:MAG TPA: CDP-alcohol phosphatidyltransferase family protein [Calidithermus sp.]|nr:CDP-alcohol phosphatidyltransferase family protein [Calidithermus sp.]